MSCGSGPGAPLISESGKQPEQGPIGPLREATQPCRAVPPRRTGRRPPAHHPAAMEVQPPGTGGREAPPRCRPAVAPLSPRCRPAVASLGEAESQDRFDGPSVRRQPAFGIRAGHSHRPRGHRAQPIGHLPSLMGEHTRIGEGPAALGSRHRSTDEQPVVVVRVTSDLGELITQRAEFDTARTIAQEHSRRMSRAPPALPQHGSPPPHAYPEPSPRLSGLTAVPSRRGGPASGG
jgi:hypothetical protein